MIDISNWGILRMRVFTYTYFVKPGSQAVVELIGKIQGLNYTTQFEEGVIVAKLSTTNIGLPSLECGWGHHVGVFPFAGSVGIPDLLLPNPEFQDDQGLGLYRNGECRIKTPDFGFSLNASSGERIVRIGMTLNENQIAEINNHTSAVMRALIYINYQRMLVEEVLTFERIKNDPRARELFCSLGAAIAKKIFELS